MQEYPVFVFRQSENAPVQVVFVAPSCDIDLWARVPTRMSSRPRGFQRAQLKTHVNDLRKFFEEDTTKTNSSPTSVLLGLEPARNDSVDLVDQNGESIDLEGVGTEPVAGTLRVVFPEWDSASFDSVVTEISALFAEIDEIESAAAAIDQEPADAAPEESDDEGEPDDAGDVADSEFDFEADTGVDDDQEGDGDADGGNTEEGEVSWADLAPDLRLADLPTLRARWEAEDPAIRTAERLEELRRLLKDERKPALIIDGQHRISATKDLPDTPFAVSLLINADWPELAFQFIVNNSTAKKVDDNLLFAIVGQSLNTSELSSIESRLNRAGIKVQLIRASTRVQIESNPFHGMLRTRTVGESGFLDASAMQKQVIGLWYGKRNRLGDTPGMASFQANRDPDAPSRRHNMADLFLANCPGARKADRMLNWQNDRWFEYFSAFWQAIEQSYVGSGVWPPTVDAWPNVPPPQMSADQLRVNQLMRATVLGPLQIAVLQRWADMRSDQAQMASKQVRKMKIEPAEFQAEIKTILLPLTADFFINLSATGLDGSAAVKKTFIRAIQSVLMGTQTVAAVQSNAAYNSIFAG